MHTEDVQLTIMPWHMKRFISYVYSKDLGSVAQSRPPQTPQLVWEVGDETYTTLKFVVGSFEFDSIIRTEGSILDSFLMWF